MDDIVRAALKKWPQVPACHGWLALDARGDWYMRDDRVQAAGPFPRVKGSRIQHEKLIDFIARNYEADARGAWFFQNGPQRVYVELEAAPFVWRLRADERPGEPPAIESHTHQSARFESAWLDEHGRLFVHTDLGFGLVHTLDMEAASDAVESRAWPVSEAGFASFPARFRYVLSPAAAP